MYFLGTESPTGLKHIDSAVLAADELQLSICLSLPAPGLRVETCAPGPSFYVESGDPNPGPQLHNKHSAG